MASSDPDGGKKGRKSVAKTIEEVGEVDAAWLSGCGPLSHRSPSHFVIEP